MRYANRNKKTYYIASRDTAIVDDYGNHAYKEPFKMRSNLVSLQSDSDVVSYGDRIKNMYKTSVPKSQYKGKIHEYDKVYINNSPDGEADYRVESVRETLNTLRIYFERLP